MPYIRERANKDGSVRHYWIRPGFKMEALPDDETERAIKAIMLNRDADKGLRRATATLPAEEDPRMFAYWVEAYQKSDPFAALSASSKKSYRITCRRLSEKLGTAPVEGITTRAVRQYVAGEPSLFLKHRIRAVIRNIMNLCIDEGMVDANPVVNVRLKNPPARSEIYTDEDVLLNLAAIDKEPAERRAWLRMAFMLELYTGQRIGDCLKMTWGAYNGEFIDAVQEKTGKAVSIYCHSILKAELDAAKVSRAGTCIVQRADGTPVRYEAFRPHMKRVRATVGLNHLRNHDLRRTAATRLVEAGNDLSLVASITGHSEASIRILCEVYIQKTRRMSKAAITRLEQYQNVNADVNDSKNAGEKRN